MFKKLVFEHDWVITIIAVLLVIIGLTTLYSTSVGASQLGISEYYKQIIFAVVGLAIYLAISRFDYTLLNYSQIIFILYGVTTFLLIFLLILTIENLEANCL